MSNHWLFKSEPDHYSVADLAAEPQGRVRWDGIRNYQARNLLRDQVTPGDLVFFYHSSCPRPAIVGLAEVVSAPYPDPTQFDPDSPYFDPKASAEQPRWYAVDIRHRQTLNTALEGKVLRQYPELAGMVLFSNPRLSIQAVSAEEAALLTSLFR